MSNTRIDLKKREMRLREIRERQGLLRARSKAHSWRNILAGADLNYNSTMVQFSTGFISDAKMSAIEQELKERESNTD